MQLPIGVLNLSEINITQIEIAKIIFENSFPLPAFSVIRFGSGVTASGTLTGTDPIIPSTGVCGARDSS